MRRVWADVPADFIVTSAWVVGPRETQHRVTFREENDEDAEWTEAPSWGPFIKRTVIIVGAITVAVAFILLVLAVSEALYQLISSGVCGWRIPQNP
jgi:hypothetical protein